LQAGGLHQRCSRPKKGGLPIFSVTRVKKGGLPIFTVTLDKRESESTFETLSIEATRDEKKPDNTKVRAEFHEGAH
jgi:hypothetical protein